MMENYEKFRDVVSLWMYSIQNGRRLLSRVIADYFSSRESVAINDSDMKFIGDMLIAADEIIMNNLTNFALMTGDWSFDGYDCSAKECVEMAKAVTGARV